MFARRFCIFNAGLKDDADREIWTVIMMSNDENVCSCKRHTVVRRARVLFLAIALSFLGLATHYRES